MRAYVRTYVHAVTPTVDGASGDATAQWKIQQAAREISNRRVSPIAPGQPD